MQYVIPVGATFTVFFAIWTAFGLRDASEGPVSLMARLTAVLGRFFGPFCARRMPTLVERYDQKLFLLNAGDMESRGGHFIGSALGYSLIAGVFVALLAIAAGASIALSLFITVMAAVVAFVGTIRFIDIRLEERTKALDREFPYFLDFVVMTKQAGAILTDSISMFVESAGSSRLSAEMDTVVNNDAKGPGGIIGALQSYEERCPSAIGKTALMAIIAAEPVGAENSETLAHLAADMRFERKQRAEREAESIKTKIMLPVTIMLVGVMVIILAGSLPNILFGF